MENLVSRAATGKLWYDELRPAIMEAYDPGRHRVAVIYDLVTAAAGDTRTMVSKLADLTSMPSDANVEKWNRMLAAPLPKVGEAACNDMADVLFYATKKARLRLDDARTQLPTEEGVVAATNKLLGSDPQALLLGEYVRHALGTNVLAAVAGTTPAELLVSEKRIIQEVLTSTRNVKRDEVLDVWHVPFPKCWWEFSAPVMIGSVPVSAVVFTANQEAGIATASLLHKMPDRQEVKSKAAGRFKSPTGMYRAFTMGECCGVRTGEVDEPFSLAEEGVYKAAIARLWDFVTARNIRYEAIHRKPSNLLRRGVVAQYRHVQGLNSMARYVVMLTVNRVVKVPDEKGQKQEAGIEYPFRVEVPGAFHRWVYCEACGDLHRHDLIGEACRACGKQVGPRTNIRVEKYWHAPHFRGPADAPVAECVRKMQKSR